jgi:hypothetical protein
MAQIVYQRGIVDLLGAGDFLAGTIKCTLHTSTYTVNKDHDYYSDLSGEIAVGGYSPQTLASKTVAVDDTNDRALIDAADPVFSSLASGATVTQVVVWRDTTVAGTSPLICQFDITSTPTNGGNITINFDTNGLFAVNC